MTEKEIVKKNLPLRPELINAWNRWALLGKLLEDLTKRQEEAVCEFGTVVERLFPEVSTDEIDAVAVGSKDVNGWVDVQYDLSQDGFWVGMCRYKNGQLDEADHEMRYPKDLSVPSVPKDEKGGLSTAEIESEAAASMGGTDPADS